MCRVYIGSFNGGAPVRSDANPEGAALFEAEAADLLADLYAIPARACDRKVNEFVKRVRAAKIHALIVGHLRRQLPPVVGRAKAAAKLLADLPAQFAHVAREHRLPPSDFPDVNRYRDILASFDLAAFPKVSRFVVGEACVGGRGLGGGCTPNRSRTASTPLPPRPPHPSAAGEGRQDPG